jgi:hypothetical protein
MLFSCFGGLPAVPGGLVQIMSETQCITLNGTMFYFNVSCKTHLPRAHDGCIAKPCGVQFASICATHVAECVGVWVQSFVRNALESKDVPIYITTLGARGIVWWRHFHWVINVWASRCHLSHMSLHHSIAGNPS